MGKRKKVELDDWLERQLAVEKIQHSEAKRLVKRLIRISIFLAILAIAGISGGFWAIMNPKIIFIPLHGTAWPV